MNTALNVKAQCEKNHKHKIWTFVIHDEFNNLRVLIVATVALNMKMNHSTIYHCTFLFNNAVTPIVTAMR